MDTNTEVVVVVVTFNSERLLPDLFDSLAIGLQGLSWRLIVADNASSDGTVAAVRRLAPRALVVEMGTNAGYSAGINAAVAHAETHPAILVLNPDIRLAPGCGKELLSVLGRENAGIVVPRLQRGDGQAIPVLRREPTILRTLGDTVIGARRAGRFSRFGEAVMGEQHYRTESTADWAAGSAMLISRSCWDTVGEWDESFFLYSEETDFSLRARDAGFPTRLAPAALATHLEGDSKRSPSLWALLVLNRVRLYRRRHNLASAVGYWGVLLTREVSRAAIGNRPSREAVRALLSPRRLRERPGPHTVSGP